jgi:hypothetical protein
MKGRGLLARRNLVRLMVMAATLHLLLVIGIYSMGRFGLWPTMFDANGIGIPFAADCIGYRLEAISLTQTLTQQGIVPWLGASSQFLVNPFHLKIYSLSFIALGPLLGDNILAVEPLNLFYYLSILYLVFMLGREVFNEGAGLLAAWAVAFWPSLLLHTTQLFRDPLFIAAMLGLTLLCTRWLTRDCSWLGGLKTGMVGSVLTILLWLLRREMWEVVVAILLVTACLLVVKQFRQRPFIAGNLLGVALLLIVTLSLPQIWAVIEQTNHRQSQDSAATINDELSAAQDQPGVAPGVQPVPPGSGLQSRITQLRHGFISDSPQAGSNVDAEVEFNSLGDIIRYLPRAAMIGFLAPFPKAWFIAGSQVGLKGRILSGLETLLMYIAMLLGVVALWHHRRQLSVWLLLLVAGAGLTALGLVVANVGTLYRMRYAYWILLIILGAEGWRQVSARWLWKEAGEGGTLPEKISPNARA